MNKRPKLNLEQIVGVMAAMQANEIGPHSAPLRPRECDTVLGTFLARSLLHARHDTASDEQAAFTCAHAELHLESHPARFRGIYPHRGLWLSGTWTQ